MVGRATLRMVLSRTTTSRLTTSTPRIAHRRSCTLAESTAPLSDTGQSRPVDATGGLSRYATGFRCDFCWVFGAGQPLGGSRIGGRSWARNTVVAAVRVD